LLRQLDNSDVPRESEVALDRGAVESLMVSDGSMTLAAFASQENKIRSERKLWKVD
jgi:hypothetical protein